MILASFPRKAHDVVVFFTLTDEYSKMTQLPTPRSSTLLLLRLSACPTDAVAWDEFVRRYGSPIYKWCRRYGLQDADAQDVTQDVFAGVLSAVRTFDRSRGRVRIWLFRIVAHQVSDWCKKAAHRQEKGTEDTWHALASEPARCELEVRLSEEFDLELLAVAEMGVQLQIKREVWSSYVLRCKEGLALRHAAERIGIPVGHVSKYAIRVRRMVAKRIVMLEEANGTEVEGVTNGQGDSLPTPPEMAGLHL
jgi:RNA polymerase sigma factor (sigma-70 family)